MSLLTVFTAPKPFRDPHIATIQRNAVRSWKAMGEQVEVLLVGDEEGTAEAAAELGVRHRPQVECNQFGTPLVSSIFWLARETSRSPLLAYVNADVLLLPETLEVARRVREQAELFLLLGQRWDLEVREPLDFGPGWDERLRREVQARGKLHAPAGSDYFIFPRDLFVRIPDFAIGRAGWDNWMIHYAVNQPWPAIDATPTLMVVHQKHDYGHLPGGQAHYDLEETKHNAALGGGFRNMYLVLDTDKELIDGQVRDPRPRLIRLIRRVERRLQPDGEVGGGLRWFLTRRLRRLRRAVVERGGG